MRFPKKDETEKQQNRSQKRSEEVQMDGTSHQNVWNSLLIGADHRHVGRVADRDRNEARYLFQGQLPVFLR